MYIDAITAPEEEELATLVVLTEELIFLEYGITEMSELSRTGIGALVKMISADEKVVVLLELESR